MNFLSVCFGWCRRHGDYCWVALAFFLMTCWSVWMLSPEDLTLREMRKPEFFVKDSIKIPRLELDARITHLEDRCQKLLASISAKRSKARATVADAGINRQVKEVMQPSEEIEQMFNYSWDEFCDDPASKLKCNLGINHAEVKALCIQSVRFERLQCIVNLLIALDAISSESPSVEGFYTDFKGRELIIYQCNGKFEARFGSWYGVMHPEVEELGGRLKGDLLELTGTVYSRSTSECKRVIRLDQGLAVLQNPDHEDFVLVKIASFKNPQRLESVDIQLGAGYSSQSYFEDRELFLKNEMLWLSASRPGVYLPLRSIFNPTVCDHFGRCLAYVCDSRR